jgi:purine nucleosidase
VWTSAYPSFWPYPNASSNLVQDLPASRVLLESGVPSVWLPGYYVAEQLRLSLPELREHVRDQGRLGRYLYVLAETFPFLGTTRGASKVVLDRWTSPGCSSRRA